jgi:hypothetical protein
LDKLLRENADAVGLDVDRGDLFGGGSAKSGRRERRDSGKQKNLNNEKCQPAYDPAS